MGTLSAGSAATNIQPSVSAVSAYAPSRRRLEWYCESEVALMTITGQSRAVSKFSGTAIVTSACMTGDRCPRPANCRSSLGSSTWNWLKPPFVRPVAASVAEATDNAGSNARNRFIFTPSAPRSTRSVLQRHPTRLDLGHFGALGEKTLELDGIESLAKKRVHSRVRMCFVDLTQRRPGFEKRIGIPRKLRSMCKISRQ